MFPENPPPRGERISRCLVCFPSPPRSPLPTPPRDKMASGVKVAEEVKLKYDDIKKKKSYRYLVFCIKDEKLIAVEKIGDRNSNYNDFLADLMGAGPDDCR